MSKQLDDFKKKQEELKTEELDINSELEKVIVLENLKSEDLNVTEDIEAIFEGQELDKDFLTKAKLIFKTAVISKINEKVDEINENASTILQEKVDEMSTDLVKRIDDYLNFVVEEWAEENKIAVESSMKVESAEEFLDKIKDLFTESYINVPEDKVDQVDELSKQVDDLKTKLNESINDNLQMSEMIITHAKAKCIVNLSEDLTDTQIEKIASLSESIEFESEEDFTEKINDLKESYFPESHRKSSVLDEDLLEEENTDEEPPKQKIDPQMAAILKTTSLFGDK